MGDDREKDMDRSDGDGIDRLNIMQDQEAAAEVSNWQCGVYNATLYRLMVLMSFLLGDQFISYALWFTIYFATNYQNI